MQNTIILGPFSAKVAARLSGLSEHMVNYLRRYRIVTASGTGRKSGRGVPVKYCYSDVLLLRVIAQLLKKGISPLRLRKALSSMQKRGHRTDELVSKKYLATDGYNVFHVGDDIVEMLNSGQMAFAFVLELSAIRNEIGSALEALSQRAA